MRRIALALTTVAMSAGLAAAADPTGEWLVKDKVATIRIENCGGAMWGVTSWEKEPGTDNNNPDPQKRGRPTLGSAILLGMKPTSSNKWEGEIYNPTNGKKYDAYISLASPDVLQVRGCVWRFCDGEDWTRVQPQPPKPGAPKPKTAKEVCASIAELAPAGIQGSAPRQPGAPAPRR
jgi:uncharacterized protein (DUF2147 family)